MKMLPSLCLIYATGYIIALKIEKIKELLIFEEDTLSQISDKLNYSNVAHLSNQFKKITGLTPTHFKALKERRRLTIQEISKYHTKK